MNLMAGIKKVIAKVTGNEEALMEIEQEEEERELLEYWKKQFEADRQDKKEWDARFDQWEADYQGSYEFDNVSAESQDRDVRTNINFIRMAVEAVTDLNVPDPNFKAVAPDDEEAISVLKNQVVYVTRANNPKLKEINLENERRVKKFGGTFFKVHWNNSLKRAGYVGDIELSNPHPKHIIPNKGAANFDDDLEHYHHPVNRTAKYILRKWPWLTMDELEKKATLYTEFDEIIGDQKINITNKGDAEKGSGLNKYTIVETTYRDEEGDIGKLWWSGDLLIKHLPKFYYRRDEEGQAISEEMLEEPIEVRGGMIPAGEAVPYYIPNSFDLVYQPFIPRDLCCWGISMMEDLKDLQEAIKKAVFIYEESILKGRRKILTSNAEDAIKIENGFTQVITVSDPMSIKDIDLGADKMDVLLWLDKLKEWLQLLTGATNAALGQQMPNVTSGKQAMVYVEQASFKVALASAYKIAAYERLYRVIADFSLAFCDHDRPYRLTGPDNKDIFGTYNRLSMLKDLNGNIVYPDFDVEITAEAGFMKNKAAIFDAIVMLAGQHAFDPTPGNLNFLKILAKLGVPMLEEVIAQMEQEIEMQKQMAMQQAQMQAQQQQIGGMIQNLPPEAKQYFDSLPPEEQQALLAEANTGQMPPG